MRSALKQLVLPPPWAQGLRALSAAIRAQSGTMTAHEQSAMGSPPTITASSTQPSGLTQEYTLQSNPTLFRAIGGGVLYSATTYRQFPSNTATNTGSGGNLGNGLAGTSFRVMVRHTGQKLAFRMIGSAVRFRFIVDGVYVDFTGTLTSTTSGNPRYIMLDFGSSGTRTVTIEGQQAQSVMGVAVTPGDTVTAPVIAPVKLWVGGDSFVGGTGPTLECDAIYSVLSAMLGVDNRTLSGVGSTGYVATASGASYSFPNRLAVDANWEKYNAIIVANGLNDIGSSVTSIQSAAAQSFLALRGYQPSAPIIVVGPADTAAPSAPVTNYTATRDAIKAGMAGIGGSMFIDLTGVTYTKSDGTHPNSAGAVTLATEIRRQIKLNLHIA